jgi:aspartate kinase
VIVMKFGGTSLADGARIRAVTAIVRERLPRRPLVVVSALAGMTDLLERAATTALTGQPQALEPLVSELERRHRWALGGAVEEPAARHLAGLELERLLEELRGRLRSVRILGEATPRARDAILATGERLSTRIVAAAFTAAGLAAVPLDPTRLLVTDGRHGAAEPDLAATRAACERELAERLAAGHVPVIGGFVGATSSGETTTLGRGGSDTSAAVLGLALGVEEIQIWSDVDGLMTADPRLVPTARTLDRISFVEAAELARFGARVLHPPSIAPAVRSRIPVRVLNSLRPAGPGTLIVDEQTPANAPVAVASRSRLRLLRLGDPALRADPRFAAETLRAAYEADAAPELVIAAGVTVSLLVPESAGRSLSPVGGTGIDEVEARALVGVVGGALAGDAGLCERIVSRLARWRPDVVVQGGSRTSILAVVAAERLGDAVGDLHREFFGTETAA